MPMKAFKRYRYTGGKLAYRDERGYYLYPGQFISKAQYDRLPEEARMKHEVIHYGK